MSVVFRESTHSPLGNAQKAIQLLNQEYPITYVQSVFKGKPVILNRTTQSVVFRFVENRVIFDGRSSDIMFRKVREGLQARAERNT